MKDEFFINVLNSLHLIDNYHFTGVQFSQKSPSTIGLEYIDISTGEAYCWWWNIYHLAFKCREFITSSGFAYSLDSTTEGLDYRVIVWNKHHKQYFHEETEPEATFKAVQFVLENKD